jgi:hypothetical protein
VPSRGMSLRIYPDRGSQVRTGLAGGGRWIRTSGSWSRDRQTVMGEVTAFSKPGADLLGNRRFESISLQQRVACEPEDNIAYSGCRVARPGIDRDPQQHRRLAPRASQQLRPLAALRKAGRLDRAGPRLPQGLLTTRFADLGGAPRRRWQVGTTSRPRSCRFARS